MPEHTEIEDRTAPLVPNLTTPSRLEDGRSGRHDDEIDRLQRALARGD